MGGWHGGNDAFGYHIAFPFKDQPIHDGVSFNYNDIESVDRILMKYGKEIAALIIEPVLGGGWGLPASADFLKHLREETESRNILLIFDEIITGFRFCYGSAGKKIFGVEPDLITLGKIVAGGMPLGVYGGREDVMSLATPNVKGGCWVGGGTFSSHPLTMVSGITTLNQLQTHSNDYHQLNKHGESFRRKINELFASEMFSGYATGIGSMIYLKMLKNQISTNPITSRALGESVDNQKGDYFQGLLLEHGIFGYHGLGGLSFSHSEEDLETTFNAILSAISTMKS
jgi:glutamate-1-semialdehyde 2,1-aminomutase